MDLPNYAYFQGKFVPYSEAKVGVLTHGLNYGTAAFPLPPAGALSAIPEFMQDHADGI
jgi:hypothetical protein